MTKSPSSITLISMRWIVFVVILSFAFGFQPKPFTEFFGKSHFESSYHHHENTQTSILETLEVFLTGSLTHAHEHEESEHSSHEHSHKHQSNGSVGSGAAFILVQVYFLFQAIDLTWHSLEGLPDLKPCYAEILKPPIVT